MAQREGFVQLRGLAASARLVVSVSHLAVARAEILHERRRMAEREGFEPSVEFPLHTLSKRAPSTTRTSLRSSGINSLQRLLGSVQPDRAPDVRAYAGGTGLRCTNRKPISSASPAPSRTRAFRSRE